MPFAITALFGDNSSEGVNHYNAIRYRVTGAGNLKHQLQSFDDVKTQDIAELAMQATTDREPVKLANFISQRVKLKIYTTEINEVFRINRIILFAKPLWSQYPNG